MNEHRRYMNECFRAAGAFLFGRRTYEIWAAYWPTVTDPRDEIAAALNNVPKYVASRTLSEATWPGTSIIRGKLPNAVAVLKAEAGRDIFVFGSSRLAQTLMVEGLVDEYRLWLHPIILGSGKRLFEPGLPTTALRLVDAQATRSGLVGLTYTPEDSHAAEIDGEKS
jgi:dihydrofolate reductase